MPSLTTQTDFRDVQRLPFCYVCGKTFMPDERIDRDHVPPKNIFLPKDREPLWLPTHVACNSGYHEIDEKIGQLIGLRYGKVPQNRRSSKLRFAFSPDLQHGAVANLNIDEAVWRWIAGFHAALYREPLLPTDNRALVTPFPRGRMVDGHLVIDPILQQHLVSVERIKLNRARNNLDKISANRGRLQYECVWYQSDNQGLWMCMFALDLCDWKDLGRTDLHPARGCAGYYVLSSGNAPRTATKGVTTPIRPANLDPLDPFGS